MLEIKEAINSGYLVMADSSQLDEEKLNNKDFTACLLHEIGHVLNQLNTPEYVDMKRIKGGIKKLIIKMPKSFNDDRTKERTERIKSEVKPKNAF
jgi:predicted HD phosphohydrolase